MDEVGLHPDERPALYGHSEELQVLVDVLVKPYRYRWDDDSFRVQPQTRGQSPEPQKVPISAQHYRVVAGMLMRSAKAPADPHGLQMMAVVTAMEINYRRWPQESSGWMTMTFFAQIT